MRRPPTLNPGLALLPLRAFLGATFVYAGVQKLSDPGFLRPGASTYIGTQLRGFAQSTPGGFLLRTFALPQAQVAGVAVAITEIAVGLLVLAGLAALLKGRPTATRALATAPVRTPAHPTRRRRRPRVPQGAVRLGASSQLPAGSGALYTDPNDGQADIVVRHPSGGLTACSAICPHARCRVEYSSGELVCPCHGSIFDSRTGAVRQLPAVQPLAVRHVLERAGSIYALPS